MLTPRANVHGHVLPPPGEVGRLAGLTTVDPKRRCIAESYPLTDSPDYRYSIGVHTVVVRFLDNGERMRASGFWFVAE